MTRALTPEQEARVREIAIDVAIAAALVQAGHAAGEAIDRYRVSASELEEFLGESLAGPQREDV